MTDWNPQRFQKAAREVDAPPALVRNAINAANAVTLRHAALPPILSLRHLADQSDVPYPVLRSVIERRAGRPYLLFRIRKQGPDAEHRYRLITVPSPQLMQAQRWIARRVLRAVPPHPASTAFAPGRGPVATAWAHCGARWLVKVDVKSFFESLTEIGAYRVYASLGYQPLIAFELARLSTRVRTSSPENLSRKWRAANVGGTRPRGLPAYWHEELGYLPQGAPTSPMLSNLCMRGMDERLSGIADGEGFTYTRYADDITFSARAIPFDRDRARRVVGRIYKELGAEGLSPNLTKTQIVPPGARKVVLGLLVDGDAPRLPKRFKSALRMHLHHLTREGAGPAAHAEARGFDSILSMRAHIEGLIAYARQVEPTYGEACRAEFRSVDW